MLATCADLTHAHALLRGCSVNVESAFLTMAKDVVDRVQKSTQQYGGYQPGSTVDFGYGENSYATFKKRKKKYACCS